MAMYCRCAFSSRYAASAKHSIKSDPTTTAPCDLSRTAEPGPSVVATVRPIDCVFTDNGESTTGTSPSRTPCAYTALYLAPTIVKNVDHCGCVCTIACTSDRTR